MPALVPVHNTLGAFFIGTILSSTTLLDLIEPDRVSSIYGITWLQVYSYYNNHSSRDRWPLKSFVAFLMLVDSANVAFIIQTNYHVNVTNFGDYQSLPFVPWSLPAITLSSYILEVSVELIYRREFTGVFHLWDTYFSPGLSIATFGCKVLCDVLITFGMVHALLGNRTQVRRTNNVLNTLAIYSINCGALNLLLTPSPERSLLSIELLNSRDNLREMLDGPEGVVMFSQLKARTGTNGVQVTTETSTNVVTPKSLPPVSSGTLISDIDIAFNRVKYPVPLPGVLTI
ncbi:hypothetical protein EDB83DRAFT_2312048 [Lactarius deliciosus]|nr:hypothetical protein EDB83DRAFT_2312048 [Lactarius deliciosus]